jgi:guanine deaminase
MSTAMTAEDFMRRAIALSREKMEQGAGGPFGAVIVKDGQIIAEGFNQVTSRNDPTAHAEVVAIRAACTALGSFSLRGSEIYTSCEPCPMCLAAIYWARIDRIFYGNERGDAARIGFDDDFLYREIALPLEARSIATTQLLAGEAHEVFAAWDLKPDKTPY